MKFILCILLVICSLSVFSQNLYDSLHTARFADYLYKTQQYEFAAQEYQRLLFFTPQDSNVQYKIVQSYHKTKQYQKGINALEGFFVGNLKLMPASFALEYTKLHLFLNQTQALTCFLNQNQSLKKSQQEYYQLGILLLEDKFQAAFEFAQTHAKDSLALNQLALSSSGIRTKSPTLAAALSTVFPCAGKFYTRNTKDAWVTILLIGSNAYCAYRGFERNGKKSVYGWICAGFATSFYLSGIYGSYHAAQRYNHQQHETISIQARSMLLAD